jgi:hypothetical protein
LVDTPVGTVISVFLVISMGDKIWENYLVGEISVIGCFGEENNLPTVIIINDVVGDQNLR